MAGHLPHREGLAFNSSKRRLEHPETDERGGRGIRTPGGLRLNGFQDRRNRPLCHPSVH